MTAAATNGETADIVLRVSGLRTKLGSNVIHDNLDLTVHRGEIMGIVGGSGTGKSVLLRTLVGLIRPVAGEITVLGKDITRLNDEARATLQRRIGVLFQDGALFSSLTVAQNIMLPLAEHTDLPPALRLEIAEVKLNMVGLPPANCGLTMHALPTELKAFTSRAPGNSCWSRSMRDSSRVVKKRSTPWIGGASAIGLVASMTGFAAKFSAPARRRASAATCPRTARTTSSPKCAASAKLPTRPVGWSVAHSASRLAVRVPSTTA